MQLLHQCDVFVFICLPRWLTVNSTRRHSTKVANRVRWLFTVPPESFRCLEYAHVLCINESRDFLTINSESIKVAIAVLGGVIQLCLSMHVFILYIHCLTTDPFCHLVVEVLQIFEFLRLVDVNTGVLLREYVGKFQVPWVKYVSCLCHLMRIRPVLLSLLESGDTPISIFYQCLLKLQIFVLMLLLWCHSLVEGWFTPIYECGYLPTSSEKIIPQLIIFWACLQRLQHWILLILVFANAFENGLGGDPVHSSRFFFVGFLELSCCSSDFVPPTFVLLELSNCPEFISIIAQGYFLLQSHTT